MSNYFPPIDSAEDCAAEMTASIDRSHSAPVALRKSMAKTLKTADELRELILDRARENRICPPGMSVHIRRLRAGWGIDCVPPTISKAAHTDCCELLIRIATELREEYDLSEEK